jgi:hypothetical protein
MAYAFIRYGKIPPGKDIVMENGKWKMEYGGKGFKFSFRLKLSLYAIL